MKIGIIYYSKSGNTKQIAEKIKSVVEKENVIVDLIEVKAVKDPGIFKAGHAALKQKELPIKNTATDLSEYDKLTFGAPLWAGNPAPYIKSFLEKATGMEGKNCNFYLTLAGAPEKQTAAFDIFRDLLSVNKLVIGNNNAGIRMNRKGVIRNEAELLKFIESLGN